MKLKAEKAINYFKSIHHTTQCSELLKCDLRSEEGHNFAVENKLFEKICQKCISDAIGIIEELTVLNHQ